MRPSPRRTLAGIALGALVIPLAACSDSGDAGADGTVTITVSGRPAAANPAAVKLFDDKVAAFEKANPDIRVKTNEYEYDQQSFQAKVAGGNLETVVRVPLTEMSSLIKRKQVSDITEDFKQVKHGAQFNDEVLSVARGEDGRTYGVPTEEYALGLVYNRKLFEKAGLDPDSPPTTWDEVREAAKTIKDKTGVDGYAQMTKENTGGWMLTAMTYSFGDDMQEQSGGRWVNSFHKEGSGSHKALDLLKEMRWTDKSMGRNQLRNGGDIERDFAAGKIGMTMAAPNMINHVIDQYKSDKNDVGIGPMPSDGSAKRTLVGGNVAVISPKASPEQRAAAVKFIDFYYLASKYDPKRAGDQAAVQNKDGLTVGSPLVAFFKPEISDPVEEAVNKHANVPLEHFAAYRESLGDYELVVEPPVEGQNVYKALDNAVQAVLTREDADPAKELNKANDLVKSQVERAQQ
ncbi:hypothetical protein AQ490_05650 [Wenjunlia vitaminophila]|uniref:Extracellular solute-binding protein n=1 Tax=Wenjunlia vitaminophila TaxID=76728 RepID=A0A0T6LPD7_WENVI|nr:extracellular solute-binding protein [Wenjunlia vitaminophila]KRV47844.1 hypothetical protein AQ490_05650 [Wenjunlia vitaminophila]